MTTTTEDQQPVTRADLRNELQHYATKADIAELRGELRAGLSELRGEMHTGLSELRGEMHTGLSELRGELHKGLSELQGELHKGLAELRGELRADQAGLRGELQTYLADWAANPRREFEEDLRARFRVLQLTVGGIGIGLVALNLVLKFLA